MPCLLRDSGSARQLLSLRKSCDLHLHFEDPLGLGSWGSEYVHTV